MNRFAKSPSQTTDSDVCHTSNSIAPLPDDIIGGSSVNITVVLSAAFFVSALAGSPMQIDFDLNFKFDSF